MKHGIQPFPRISISVMGLVIGLLGLTQATAYAQCSALEPKSNLPMQPFPSHVDADPAIDSRDACPSWRWVALRPAGETECPGEQEARENPIWSARSLFPGAVEPGLQPFCVYELERGAEGANLEDRRRKLERLLENFVSEGRLSEVASGCAAVGPTAQNTTAATMRDLRRFADYFYNAARDLPESMPARDLNGLAGSNPPNVRVAVVDTQPTHLNANSGQSNHGFALAEIIRRLTCHDLGGDTQCSARVGSRLALPIDEFNVHDPDSSHFNWTRGGYFGTIDQLAQAVREELSEWDEENEKLVLNLSVAWVGERFGGLEAEVSEMPPPVQSLYEVLRVANCRGALVLTAAGNRVGGPALESGPLLPAAWENRPAPPPSLCPWIRGETESPPDTPTPPSDEPLLYAVAGIHHDGAPLVNARPDSEPVRVAYADHAVVEISGREPAVLTGSSVGTAVVSAAAASVWHYRDDLNRAELMELVDSSGSGLGRQARLVAPRTSPSEVRRVGVCPALAAACNGPAACPGVSSITCPSAELRPKLSDVEEPCQGVDPSLIQHIKLPYPEGISRDQNYCDRPVLRYVDRGTKVDRPCPFRQYFGIHARPWTGPQPSSDPCAGCSISPPPGGPGAYSLGEREPVGCGDDDGYRLWARIDPSWNGPPLENAVLGIGDVRLAIDHEPLQPGSCLFVERIPVENLLDLPPDASIPPPALYFYTAEGSLSGQLFLGR